MRARAEVWLLVARGDLEQGRVVRLDSTESHHAAGPLRRSVGDRVVLVDGIGTVAEAVLRRVSSRGCEAEVIAVRRVPIPPENAIEVAVGVLHGRAMDWTVQKAVELGVGRLIPVCSDRSQLSLKAAAGRLEHWRRVALQALKQCHRPWAMEVGDPIALIELVRSRGSVGGRVADRNGFGIGELAADVEPMLLVGPEGGFSVAESELLDDAGWPRLRFGRNVLRAETAVAVGAALLAEKLRTD
jgi:16S rRNA (uracil1498-N3)-methyltransferase